MYLLMYGVENSTWHSTRKLYVRSILSSARKNDTSKQNNLRNTAKESSESCGSPSQKPCYSVSASDSLP